MLGGHVRQQAQLFPVNSQAYRYVNIIGANAKQRVRKTFLPPPSTQAKSFLDPAE